MIINLLAGNLQSKVIAVDVDRFADENLLLSDSLAIVDFPTDRPRSLQVNFDVDRQDWDLNSELVSNLKQLGTKSGCSLMTTILAGFEVWLHRLTGQNDLVVGIGLGDNHLAGCVNLLPLRTWVDGEISFDDYLQTRQSSILDAYEHQQFISGSSIDKLALSRELFVNVVEIDGKIVLEYQYNNSLFDRDTISRRMAEFETLLLGIIADSALPIAKLPLLTAKDRQQLLVEWNRTQTNYPHTKCIHHLFEEQVQLTPDAIAIEFNQQHLTYRELNDLANQLANYLISLRVGADTLVGICVERSLEMIVGLLGILKAGGAYVPVDPNYPTERVEYMLDCAQAKVLVTQQSIFKNLPKQRSVVVCLDTDWEQIAQQSAKTPIDRVKPDNIAYVIYTSGSTGKPKGVQVLHRGVVNFLTFSQQELSITAEDAILAITSLSFDPAVLEIFLPIMVGARLVLVSREVAMDGKQLSATISAAGITMMQATPATWQLLLESGWSGEPHLKLGAGGEAMSRELATQLLSRSAAVWNFYGPTETTIASTFYQVGADRRQIPIGKPIANTEIYILDPQIQPVPIGVVGELHIGGVGLATGYWQQPELTVEKFIPHPFSEIPNSRLYKTGDLARYLPDGNIECLGRIDNQVKIRGFRIELGEIETLLNQHPGVAQSTVIVREDVQGDRRLVAYIVLDRESTPNTSQLRQFLQQKLPDYLIPSAFVTLPTLPLTPNGKIDRSGLPEPDSASLNSDTNFVAPSNPTAEVLAKIWSQVLRVEQIGIHDNFFELGGHSLLATQVISRIRQAFSMEIPLQALFEQPTIAGLSDRINTLLWIAQSRQASSTFTINEMEEFEV
jgi:amino acid adenylation domain-containing protein